MEMPMSMSTKYPLGSITEKRARELCPHLFKKNRVQSTYEHDKFNNSGTDYKKNDFLIIVNDSVFGSDNDDFEIVIVESAAFDIIGEYNIRVSNGEFSWRVKGISAKI